MITTQLLQSAVLIIGALNCLWFAAEGSRSTKNIYYFLPFIVFSLALCGMAVSVYYGQLFSSVHEFSTVLYVLGDLSVLVVILNLVNKQS